MDEFEITVVEDNSNRYDCEMDNKHDGIYSIKDSDGNVTLVEIEYNQFYCKTCDTYSCIHQYILNGLFHPKDISEMEAESRYLEQQLLSLKSRIKEMKEITYDFEYAKKHKQCDEYHSEIVEYERILKFKEEKNIEKLEDINCKLLETKQKLSEICSHRFYMGHNNRCVTCGYVKNI